MIINKCLEPLLTKSQRGYAIVNINVICKVEKVSFELFAKSTISDAKNVEC